MINFAEAALITNSVGDVCNADSTQCWPALIHLVSGLLNYLVLISGSLAAISFAYAGWLYMISGGDSGKVAKAKEIFLKVAIGFIFVLAGWLIVHEILVILGVQSGFSLV